MDELRDLLIRELNLPANLRWFEVRFAQGEPVSIKCEFLAGDPEPEEEDPQEPSYGSLDD